MPRFQPDFVGLLDGFSLETLEKAVDSIFALGPDLTFSYFNPAWFEFACKNEGEPSISERFTLGTRIEAAISGEVRHYYLEAFRCVLMKKEVWHHDYQCSTPELYRLYHQSVYPLKNESGLIVVNSLAVEQPHDPAKSPPHEAVPNLYLADTGFINQCSNCRRTQRARQPEIWDWVPALVADMPDNTSHTLCKICFDYYYGQGSKG